MSNFIKFSLIIGFSLISTVVLADIHQSHNHHEQKAHVHGVSKMQIAIDEHQIDIQFESPANNIVGFEHTAKTENEIQAVKRAQHTLEQSKSLFAFIGTSCTNLSTKIDLKSLFNKHQHKENSHKEISAYYQFSCQSLKNLQRIDLNFFNQFPNIAEIHIQWLSSTQQGKSVLTPSNHQLNFGE